ncbi:MAG: hypothetical protein ABIJ45_10150 [Candidatus Zixiibacteriota bacterium]
MRDIWRQVINILGAGITGSRLFTLFPLYATGNNLYFKQMNDNLFNNNRSGSSEILLDTINYTYEYFLAHGYEPEFIQYQLEYLGKIQMRFKEMALVYNGVEKLKAITAKGGHITGEIRKMRDDINSIDTRIIANCARLFERKISLTTFSNSGLVKKVVHHYRDKIERIYLSESRPVNEGRVMAQFFAELGIEVVFVIDMSLFGQLCQSSLLLLGADSIGPNFFVNKIGTKALALSAREYKVKTVVVHESLKITPSDSLAENMANRDKSEIWPDVPENITIINKYFELIPNRLIDEFITD